MKKVNVILVLMVITSLIIVACSSNETNSGIQQASQTSTAGNSGLLDVSIAGSVSGGVFYVQSAAMAEMANNTLDNVRITVEVTSGGHENAIVVDTKENAMGISTTLAIYEFMNGLGNFPHQAENLTAMAFSNPNELHLVVPEDSDIYSIADLKGKVVNPGSRGSGTESSIPSLLAPLGMSYDDFGRVEYLGFSEAADAMRNGTVDAIFWLGGYPASSIQELATTVGIRIVPFSQEEIDTIIREAPYFQQTIIPGGVYTGVDEDISTVAVPSIFLVNKNLPEDFVYELTKMTHENIEQLAKSHVGFNTWSFTGEIENFVPLHPGAKRYYEEKGF